MLISPEMVELNRKLFEKDEAYGITAGIHRDMVRRVSSWGRKTILDYGAGRETMKIALGPAYKVTSYDPCIAELSASPVPHDVVYCGDVLEHVEPELLGNVLAHIRELTKETAVIVVALRPSSKFYDDGRNAHLIVEGKDWWENRLKDAGFIIKQVKPLEKTINLGWWICEPRKDH